MCWSGLGCAEVKVEVSCITCIWTYWGGGRTWIRMASGLVDEIFPSLAWENGTNKQPQPQILNKDMAQIHFSLPSLPSPLVNMRLPPSTTPPQRPRQYDCIVWALVCFFFFPLNYIINQCFIVVFRFNNMTTMHNTMAAHSDNGTMLLLPPPPPTS